jgi:nitrile hydratase beta subunit
MNGIHDMGGMDGFGRIHVERDEPVFHAPWQARVFGLVALAPVGNTDAFRHAIERIDPEAYLAGGYYGRWMAAIEMRLVEEGMLAMGEVDARMRGEPAPGPPGRALGLEGEDRALRHLDSAPRFAVGDAVRARNHQPRGHTRLPGYARSRRGRIARVHPAWVYPDTHAHGRGEQPTYAYAVRFAARELWGADADPAASVCVDLFEPYLDPDSSELAT